MSLLTKDYHYHLPGHLIASHPLPDRAASRMLVIDRASGSITHTHFSRLESFLSPTDLLVLNDTRVIPARLHSDDKTIELLCLEQLSPTLWRCIGKPGKKLKPHRTLTIGGITGQVTQILPNGDRLIQWNSPLDLHTHGQLALPHYIGRNNQTADLERYQTTFSKHEGAIAAPTAGLHFTPEILQRIPHTFITLHVGVGTFRPVSTESITEHQMHSEKYHITPQTASAINSAKRIVAVGTTVTRVLETLAGTSHRLDPQKPLSGSTDIFLHPPHTFKAVDTLLTNFHLPESTLIMLVSAFAGKELTLEAYHQAVAAEYRFYSYGDCMLIL